MRRNFPVNNSTPILEDLTGKFIQVVYCWSRSESYKNIIPKSYHQIISPNDPMMRNTENKVWIMGTNGPVLLHKEEFILITPGKRNKFGK